MVPMDLIMMEIDISPDLNGSTFNRETIIFNWNFYITKSDFQILEKCEVSYINLRIYPNLLQI